MCIRDSTGGGLERGDLIRPTGAVLKFIHCDHTEDVIGPKFEASFEVSEMNARDLFRTNAAPKLCMFVAWLGCCECRCFRAFGFGLVRRSFECIAVEVAVGTRQGWVAVDFLCGSGSKTMTATVVVARVAVGQSMGTIRA